MSSTRTDFKTLLADGPAVAPRRSLASEAADVLREMILLEKLTPGLPVPERDLAEALGISRTPLKEALLILKSEGLIVHSATRRSSVADPSLEEVSENLIVLGVLEALAGELACKHASDAEITQILELCDRMRNASLETDPLNFFSWDMEFHQSIVRAARNTPLMESHRVYNARLWRARFISSKRRTSQDTMLGHHDLIAEALQKRDGPEAGRQLRRHLETAVINITETLGTKNQAISETSTNNHSKSNLSDG